MERVDGAEVRSASCGGETEEIAVESLQFGEEIQRLMSVPVEAGSSFTALLELPAYQAMELLHSSGPEEKTTELAEEPWSRCPMEHPKPYQCTPFFPSNAALIDRASKLSVFAAADISPETSSIPSNSSANSRKVKQEPVYSDSNPNSSPAISDPMVPIKNPKPTKRKEREKKAKESNKKSKAVANEKAEDAEKLPYIHVRARRGQATDSHSLAERARREKINYRMKLLQELVPGCNKITGTAMVLDEIINHVQYLQRQVEFLSMRLAAVNPRIDINLDSLFAAENGSLTDSDFSPAALPLMRPEEQFDGNRQYQQLWHFDGAHQPVWSREEDNRSLFTPEHSLLSNDSSANSGVLTESLHTKLVKMEL